MNKKRTETFEFKIIAGSLKGKTITAPDLGITRPPLTRLRKAIFDFLNPYLDDTDYLDLFSGTGSYLFEAVSRGARTATGVELEPQLVEAINRQSVAYGVSDRLHCHCENVFDAIKRLHKSGYATDIIMMAPPQYLDLITKTLSLFKEYPILAEGGMIICQHDTSEKKILFQDYDILQQRKYGNTTFTILSRGN
ncbi:MAG: RsmD family RNA methyltransferase [bacterium]